MASYTGASNDIAEKFTWVFIGRATLLKVLLNSISTAESPSFLKFRSLISSICEEDNFVFEINKTSFLSDLVFSSILCIFLSWSLIWLSWFEIKGTNLLIALKPPIDSWTNDNLLWVDEAPIIANLWPFSTIDCWNPIKFWNINSLILFSSSSFVSFKISKINLVASTALFGKNFAESDIFPFIDSSSS